MDKEAKKQVNRRYLPIQCHNAIEKVKRLGWGVHLSLFFCLKIVLAVAILFIQPILYIHLFMENSNNF